MIKFGVLSLRIPQNASIEARYPPKKTNYLIPDEDIMNLSGEAAICRAKTLILQPYNKIFSQHGFQTILWQIGEGPIRGVTGLILAESSIAKEE